jgi:hypothetical protein
MEKRYFGPRNPTAEAEYRACWLAYLGCKDPAQKEMLEKEMDRLQPQIAYSPQDKRWDDFVDTLPGFREFWGRFAVEAKEMLADIQRKYGLEDGDE